VSFKLLWQSRTQDGKRTYSERWSRGARAYIRGYHDGHSYFESLETGDRIKAQTNFTKRSAEIVKASEKPKSAKRRCNFAYAVTLYFGTADPAIKDPTNRIAKIFDKWATRFLDEIEQVELDKLARELRPSAGPKTLNREVYTPFISVYNAAVEAGKAPQRKWKRPDGANAVRPTNPPTDKDINKLILVAADSAAHSGRSPRTAARNRAALLTVTLTGERTTAVSKTIWRHIDFAAGTYYYPETKNRKERRVLMPPLLIRALKAYAELCTLEGALGPDPDARVFGWETRSGLSIMVRRARRKAKLGNVRPHDIGRHSFGRRLTAGGMDRRRLKKAGNWESDAAVERYEHFELDEVSMAVRDVDTTDLEAAKTSDKISDEENSSS